MTFVRERGHPKGDSNARFPLAVVEGKLDAFESLGEAVTVP